MKNHQAQFGYYPNSHFYSFIVGIFRCREFLGKKLVDALKGPMGNPKNLGPKRFFRNLHEVQVERNKLVLGDG
jgi:hypothetical protein